MLGAYLLTILLIGTATAFHYETRVVLNNRTYREVVEQPWFRVRHKMRIKIDAAHADKSSFGKHHTLPQDDIVIPYNWTKIEKQTFPCMNLACVCAFFGRDNSSSLRTSDVNACILPDGRPLKKAIRKEIRMLSDEERKRVERALNEMKRDDTYNRLARVHKYHGIHEGPAFTLWHRELLKRFEFTVRKYQPSPHTLGMPYWDTTLDALLPEPKDSIMFSPIFLGTTDEEDHVVTGPYANWTTMDGNPWITRRVGADPEGEFLTPSRVDFTISQKNVTKVLAATTVLSTCEDVDSLDLRLMEYSHNFVHAFIGGDMRPSWSSANDVIFLLHHSMIDYVFELFRQKGQTREQREKDYPRTNKNCFPEWHNWDFIMPYLDPIRNIDGLSNGYTDNLYEFEPRPTCSEAKRTCGSKYLFCNVRRMDGPICMSKVRMGGNCLGFDGTDICYQGTCKAGRCLPAVDGLKPKMEKLPLSPTISKLYKLGAHLNMR